MWEPFGAPPTTQVDRRTGYKHARIRRRRKPRRIGRVLVCMDWRRISQRPVRASNPRQGVRHRARTEPPRAANRCSGVAVPGLPGVVLGYFFSSFPSLLTIVSWNDEEIVANNEALCATTTTTINAQAKEVYAITRNNGNKSCAPLMTPLAKPRISKLVSGFNVSQDYFTKMRKEADGYRSKEYQEYLEVMRGSIGSAEKGNAPTQSKAQTDALPPAQ